MTTVQTMIKPTRTLRLLTLVAAAELEPRIVSKFMRLPALSASEGQEARRFDEPKISAAAFAGEKCRFQFCIERYQSIRRLFLSLAKTLAATCLLRHPWSRI